MHLVHYSGLGKSVILCRVLSGAAQTEPAQIVFRRDGFGVFVEDVLAMFALTWKAVAGSCIAAVLTMLMIILVWKQKKRNR